MNREECIKAYCDRMQNDAADYYVNEEWFGECYDEGRRQMENEVRTNLLKFLADNITHGCDKGLILNIPDYTTLIEKLSDKLGFDLMPILKRNRYKADD